MYTVVRHSLAVDGAPDRAQVVSKGTGMLKDQWRRAVQTVVDAQAVEGGGFDGAAQEAQGEHTGAIGRVGPFLAVAVGVAVGLLQGGCVAVHQQRAVRFHEARSRHGTAGELGMDHIDHDTFQRSIGAERIGAGSHTGVRCSLALQADVHTACIPDGDHVHLDGEQFGVAIHFFLELHFRHDALEVAGHRCGLTGGAACTQRIGVVMHIDGAGVVRCYLHRSASLSKHEAVHCSLPHGDVAVPRHPEFVGGTGLHVGEHAVLTEADAGAHLLCCAHGRDGNGLRRHLGVVHAAAGGLLRHHNKEQARRAGIVVRCAGVVGEVEGHVVGSRRQLGQRVFHGILAHRKIPSASKHHLIVLVGHLQPQRLPVDLFPDGEVEGTVVLSITGGLHVGEGDIRPIHQVAHSNGHRTGASVRILERQVHHLAVLRTGHGYEVAS